MTNSEVLKIMIETDPEILVRIKNHEEGMQGFTDEEPKLLQFWPFKNYIKFANSVAAAEREACARVCDEVDRRWINQAEKCAERIRARGEEDAKSNG